MASTQELGLDPSGASFPEARWIADPPAGVSQTRKGLHSDCDALAWMLGTWRGNGCASYPTIDTYTYGQKLTVVHDGRPFLHYLSRAWIVDEQGAFVGNASMETGFLRCLPGVVDGESRVESVVAHATGFAEIWHGTAVDGKLDLTTCSVGQAPTAKNYTSGRRRYEHDADSLLFVFDMTAEGQGLHPHLRARLRRVQQLT